MAGAAAENRGSRLIVVGVDASLGSRIALEHAARRAGGNGRLLVAHTVSALPDAIGRAVGELDHVRRDIARQLVGQQAAIAGVDAEGRVLDGAPAEAMAGLAREVHADEIVVGTRGMGRFAAALGSVSHALLAHADRPVVVVPPVAADHPRDAHDHGMCTVIVGYDGSSSARAAVDYAAERAASGGRVVAVHAFQPTPDWLGSPHYQRALEAYQAEGQKLLRNLEDDGPAGIDLTTSLLEGPPARALVAAADARDADEIVLGSRGFGPLRGIMGSVSHAVLHEADRPVVVIPAEAVAPAAGAS